MFVVKIDNKPRVVLQPPERRLRNDQVLSTLGYQLFQPPDGIKTVGGVVTSIRTVTGTRGMPRPSTIQIEQLVVPAAHDEHGCVGRDTSLDRRADALDQLPVPVCPPPFIRLPLEKPLLFPA